MLKKKGGFMGADMDPTDLVEGFQLNHHCKDPFYFMGFKFSSSCFERRREPLGKKKGEMSKSTKEFNCTLFPFPLFRTNYFQVEENDSKH